MPMWLLLTPQCLASFTYAISTLSALHVSIRPRLPKGRISLALAALIAFNVIAWLDGACLHGASWPVHMEEEKTCTEKIKPLSFCGINHIWNFRWSLEVFPAGFASLFLATVFASVLHLRVFASVFVSAFAVEQLNLFAHKHSHRLSLLPLERVLCKISETVKQQLCKFQIPKPTRFSSAVGAPSALQWSHVVCSNSDPPLLLLLLDRKILILAFLYQISPSQSGTPTNNKLRGTCWTFSKKKN